MVAGDGRHGLVHRDREAGLLPGLLLRAHGGLVLVVADIEQIRPGDTAGDAHLATDLHPLGVVGGLSAQLHGEFERALPHCALPCP